MIGTPHPLAGIRKLSVCVYVCMYERTEKGVGTPKFPRSSWGSISAWWNSRKLCDEGESTVESRVARTWVPSAGTGVDEASKYVGSTVVKAVGDWF